MRTKRTRILLVAVAVTLVIGLWAMRAAPVPSTPPQADAPHVVNKPGFWQDLLDLEPDPFEDCSEVTAWMKEHQEAFQSRIERKEVHVTVQYRPAACMTCLELGDVPLASAAYTERAVQLARSDQFVLRIQAPPTKTDIPAVDDTWVDRIVEIVGRDTVPCAFIHVETMPPGVPFRSVLLGFDRAQDAQDRKLMIRDHDQVLGGDLVFTMPTGGPRALAEAMNPSSSRQ